tara:strand:- start:14659 stop:20235 length:5577 start_codon:yes stop_codon:yes gene_type:complete
MAKVPYTKVSKKIASGISRLSSNFFRPSCGHDHNQDEGPDEITTILRSAMQDLNRNYRSSGTPAENAAACADGSCETVYVPVIMHFHTYNDDPVSNYVFYGQFANGSSRIQKYNQTIAAFEELNKVFAGQYLDTVGTFGSLLNAQINDNTETDLVSNPSAFNSEQNWTKIKDFGYYTGGLVYDEETKQYVDEFVSHKELRELYPNIQFYFPKKIRKDHLLEGMYKEKTGLKVGLQELVDYLDVWHGNPIHGLLEQEYFYFAEDYPGAIFWDSALVDVEYVTKLNVLQQIINGNDKDLNISINPQTGPSYSVANPSSNVEGEDMLTMVNISGSKNTIFADMALTYDGHEYGPQNEWFTNHTEGWAQSLSIKGPANFPAERADILFHEFGHLMGRVHAWQSPSFAGVYFKEERLGSTSQVGFGSSYSLNYKTSILHSSSGDLTLKAGLFPGKGSLWGFEEVEDMCEEPLLAFDLKPPFSYDIENRKYKRALRDYNRAESEYDYWAPIVNYAINNDAYYDVPSLVALYPSGVTSTNVGSWVSNHLELYGIRKDILLEELNNTPERIIGDFGDISDEEKGYLEFVFNKFLPVLTDNFSIKTRFQSGDQEAGGSSSRIVIPVAYKQDDIPHINNMFIEGYDYQAEGNRNGMNPVMDLAADILTGVSSFWGGSYIIKNPPQLASEFEGEIVSKVFDRRYVFALRLEPGNHTYNEAVAIAEAEDGWRLPSSDEEIEIIAKSIRQHNTQQGYACDYTTLGGSSIPANFVYNLPFRSDYTSPVNQDNIDNGISDIPSWGCWTTVIPSPGGYTYRKVMSVSACPGLGWSGVPKSIDSQRSVLLIKKIDLLENPNIITQLVVNPADDDGNRIGPNISTHIPFCIQPTGTTPNGLNISMNTRYDHFWMHNFNAFNPIFPVYPDNTPVDNLLDPEFCPCLHNTQTYYNGDGNTYDFQIIGGGDNAWAAHAMMYTGTRASENMNEFRLSIGASKGDYQRIDGNVLGSEIAGVAVSDMEESKIFNLANRLASSWLLITTNKYKNGYNSPIEKFDVPLHKFSDPDQTVLSLPFFNGYCGFGWASILPKVYDLSPKAYWDSVVRYIDNNPSASLQESYGYTQEMVDFISNMPDEYNMYTCDFAWQNEIRLASRRAGASTASNNISTRYAIGSSFEGLQPYSNLDLYNPLAAYFSETSANGTYNTDHPNSFKPSLFDMSIKKDYHEDLYGEYNPLYLTDVMYYRALDTVSHLRYWSEHTVKATNYLFNYSELPHINNMQIIYQEDIGSDLELSDEFTAAFSTYDSVDSEESDFERYFRYLKNNILDFNIESEVGGCNDPTMYNYNEFATYNNGTCIEAVSGCMQDWADNYNPAANTEDGSCYGTICTNPDATGSFGAGYNASMIDTLTQYGAMYNTDAIIEAENALVSTLNSDDLNVCQFTVVPRNAILKLVCIPREKFAGLTVCNDNPIIRYIADADTGDIYNHTSNPVLMETPLLEFINTSGRTELGAEYVEDIGVFENGVSKPYLLNASTISFNGQQYYYNGIGPNGYTSHGFKTIMTGQGDPFPSQGNNGTLNNYGDYHNVISKITDKYVLGNETDYIANGTPIVNKTKYNCVENPILPDGSGGCFLYSPNGDDNGNSSVRVSACSPGQIETLSYMNCDNEILFSPSEENGGYLSSVYFLNTFNDWEQGVGTLTPCGDAVIPAQKYIVGGDLATSAIGQTNGVLITYDELPLYSNSQLHSISGYPAEVLDPNLIEPVRLANRANRPNKGPDRPLEAPVEQYVITSNPKLLLMSNYLYTENGQGYTGNFTISFNYKNESVTFNTHGRNTNSRLYFRNELLRMDNVKLTEKETLAKKMHKVINKIINLPIFTDN